MKASLEPDDADFLIAALTDAVAAGELDRTLGRFRAGRQEEHILQTLRREVNNEGCQLRPFFTRKAIVMKQPAFGLLDDGLPHFGDAVTCIRHEHT